MGVLFKVHNDVQACHQWSKLKCPRPYKGQKLSLDKPISYTIYMLCCFTILKYPFRQLVIGMGVLFKVVWMDQLVPNDSLNI